MLEAVDGAAALEVLRTRRSTWCCWTCGCPASAGTTSCPGSWPPTDDHRRDPGHRGHDVRTAVEAHQARRLRLLTKPFDVDDILVLVRAGADSGRSSARCATCARSWTRGPRLRGAGRAPPEMVRLYELITQVAPTPATVLDHRRERHRQGAGGARHPPAEPAPRPSPSWRSTAPRSPTP